MMLSMLSFLAALVCGLSSIGSIGQFCESISDGKPSRVSLAFAIINGSLCAFDVCFGLQLLAEGK